MLAQQQQQDDPDAVYFVKRAETRASRNKQLHQIQMKAMQARQDRDKMDQQALEEAKARAKQEQEQEDKDHEDFKAFQLQKIQFLQQHKTPMPSAMTPAPANALGFVMLQRLDNALVLLLGVGLSFAAFALFMIAHGWWSTVDYVQ